MQLRILGAHTVEISSRQADQRALGRSQNSGIARGTLKECDFANDLACANPTDGLAHPIPHLKPPVYNDEQQLGDLALCDERLSGHQFEFHEAGGYCIYRRLTETIPEFGVQDGGLGIHGQLYY
jgi:hypothetical protein